MEKSLQLIEKRMDKGSIQKIFISQLGHFSTVKINSDNKWMMIRTEINKRVVNKKSFRHYSRIIEFKNKQALLKYIKEKMIKGYDVEFSVKDKFLLLQKPINSEMNSG